MWQCFMWSRIYTTRILNVQWKIRLVKLKKSCIGCLVLRFCTTAFNSRTRQLQDFERLNSDTVIHLIRAKMPVL